jgi:putative cell wall-binding protein
MIADAVGAPSAILLARGDDFPDALAAGAAATSGRVIVLTDDTTMPSSTEGYLQAHPGVPVYAIGGPAAAADPSATPIVGADRYATSVAVAQQFDSTAPTTVGVATGLDFPDALSAGPALARLGAPLLLTDPDTLSSSVGTYLGTVSASLPTVDDYGGTAAVADAVLQQITAAL